MNRVNWTPTVQLLGTILCMVLLVPSIVVGEDLCSNDQDCLNQGKCVNNTCLCDSMYFGNQCEFEHKEGIFAVQKNSNDTLELVFVNSTTNIATSTSVIGLSSNQLSQELNISHCTPTTTTINAEDGVIYVGLECTEPGDEFDGWLIGIFTLNSSLILAKELPYRLRSLEYDPKATPAVLYATDNSSNVVRLTITYQYNYLYEQFNFTGNTTTVNYSILDNFQIFGPPLPGAAALDFTNDVFYLLLNNTNPSLYTLIAFNVFNDTIAERNDVSSAIVNLEFDSVNNCLYVVTFNETEQLYQLQKMDVTTQATITIVYSYDFANTTIVFNGTVINSTNLQNVTLYPWKSYLDGDLFFIYASVTYMNLQTLQQNSTELLFGVNIHNSENSSLTYWSNNDGSVSVILPQQVYYSTVNLDLPYGCDGIPGSQMVYDWCGLCTEPDNPSLLNDTFHEQCMNGGYYIPPQCGSCVCNTTMWTGAFCEQPVCNSSCPVESCVAPGVCQTDQQSSSDGQNGGNWLDSTLRYVTNGMVDNPYYTAAIAFGVFIIIALFVGICVRRSHNKKSAEKKKLISENMQEMESVRKAHMHINPTNMVSRIDSTVLTDHDSEIDAESDGMLLRDIEQGMFRRATISVDPPPSPQSHNALLLDAVPSSPPSHHTAPMSPSAARPPLTKSPSAQSNVSTNSNGRLLPSSPGTSFSDEEAPIRTKSTKGFFASRSKTKVTDWWEIDYDDIQLLDKLGEGSFGVVYKAKYRDQDVAFKTVKDPSESQLNEFKREAALMVTLKPHQNVVKFYGVCIDPNKPCGIVIEYMLGSLKKMLQNEMANLSYLQIIGIAKDIAKGMKHLHQEKIVHRDLSARNILISESKKGWVCKVADFGLARPMDLNAIGKTQSNFGPLKWMAPESLLYKAYSFKSDVWSYACTVVEVLDGGRDPFPDLDPVQAASSVMHKNVRPSIPDNCPPKLEFLLNECFQRNADQRPDFKAILTMLDEVEKDIKNNPFYQK